MNRRLAIKPIHLNDIDRQIIRSLLEDASKSKAEIARTVGLTPNAVFERLRKLDERRVIQGYAVRLNPLALGSKLLAFVFVAESKPVRAEKMGPRLAQLPNIEEVHRVAGRDCFLLKVRAADTDELTRILDEIGEIESVAAVETTIVLETFLEKRFDGGLGP